MIEPHTKGIGLMGNQNAFFLTLLWDKGKD